MPNIFTYGSLMFDQVWSRVVKGDYDRCESFLQGYDRKGIRGEVFPALFPAAPESRVQGIVYFDVAASDLVSIDRFEGEYYFRTTELVDTEEAGLISAEIYVLKEEYYTILSRHNWDAEHFSTRDIYFFIHSYLDSEEH